MQPIVDFRLGDVYRARSSSRLIYAGSRHNPGCVRRSDGAGQQGGVAGLNPAERLAQSLMSSGGPPHFTCDVSRSSKRLRDFGVIHEG